MKSSILVLIVLVSIFVVSIGPAYAAEPSAKVIVTSQIGTSLIKVGEQRAVSWRTENFPNGAFVNVNLLKKVSDSPIKYELVRQITQYGVNDGVEIWKIDKGDMGDKLYIEVTCAGSTRFTNGCGGSMDNSQLAVKDSFTNNMANTLFGLVNKLR